MILLDTIKIDAEKITVKWNNKRDDGFVDKHSIESKQMPAQEFYDAVYSFINVMRDVFGFEDYETFNEINIKEIKLNQTTRLDENSEMDEVRVTLGYSIVAEVKKDSVAMTVKTDELHPGIDEYDTNLLADKCIYKLEKEAIEFIKGKRHQENLFGGDDVDVEFRVTA